MARRTTRNLTTDAPDAGAVLSGREEAAIDDGDPSAYADDADDDGDGDPDDGLFDDDGHDPEDLDAELDALERENQAALDKADPPTSTGPQAAAAKVDPAVEREKLIGMLLPEVKAQWSHLDLKSVGRQTVEVKLTDAERLDTAHAIAAIRGKLGALDAREARLKAAVKAARAALETEQDELFTRFDRGAEDRALHVATFLDYEANAAIIVRQDTAAVVSERALTVEERQLVLPGLRQSESDGKAAAGNR